MNDKAFKTKVNRDVARTKKDFATVMDDNVAGLTRIKKDLTVLGEDGVTGFGRKFEQMSGDAKEKVSVAMNSLNRDVGDGLSRYNAKVQEVADRVPGSFGQKAAEYPWVTITISLAFGLLLGMLVKPGRQSSI